MNAPDICPGRFTMQLKSLAGPLEIFVEQEKVENSQVLFSIAHNKFINLLCVYVYIRLIVQNKGTILLNLLYLKKSV